LQMLHVLIKLELGQGEHKTFSWNITGKGLLLRKYVA